MGVDAAYTGQATYEYLNTASYGAPTWSRIARIGDVDLPDNRANNGFKTKESDNTKFLVGTRERGISFTYTRKKGDDPVYDALKAAYEAGNAGCVDVMILNGPAATVGSKGHRGPYVVVKFDEKHPHETEVTAEIELKPADAVIPAGEVDEGDPWEIEATEITV